VPAADIDGPVVTTGVVVGTVPPAGEAQNVPLVVAAKSEV
jgi:prolyl-tRNA editing enzyme YbaK/EbsC (Cys-tRNA(Pro) deacylase)